MYFVEIKDSITGKTAKEKYDFAFNRSWWEDGNMSCDCNRGLEHDLEVPCNIGKNRFLVKITDVNGSILYKEY